MDKNTQTASIVRIGEIDVKGNMTLLHALVNIKGISFSFANAICNILNLEQHSKIGTYSKEDIKKIEEIIKNPKKFKIPEWVLNRKIDPETGEAIHLTGANLDLQKKFDIRKLKKMKCYRGVRHIQNLPVRGQRTKGAFRRKGKSVGVVRRKQMPDKKKK